MRLKVILLLLILVSVSQVHGQCVGEEAIIDSVQSCCEGFDKEFDEVNGEWKCQESSWFDFGMFWIGLFIPFGLLAFFVVGVKRRMVAKDAEVNENRD